MTYEFKQVTDGALFDAFVKDNGGTVFQTSAWARVKTAWTPRLFMAFEGEKPILSVLCLERNIKLLGRLWYAAEGFVGDKNAIGGMVAFLKKKMKEYGVFSALYVLWPVYLLTEVFTLITDHIAPHPAMDVAGLLVQLVCSALLYAASAGIYEEIRRHAAGKPADDAVSEGLARARALASGESAE